MDQNTPQYNAVLKNLPTLVKAIIGTPGSLQLLQLELTSREWYNPIVNPDAGELAKLALSRIALNTEDYDEFLRILNTVGLSGTATAINATFDTLSGGSSSSGGTLRVDGPPNEEQDLWQLTCFTDWIQLEDDMRESEGDELWVEEKTRLWPQGKKLQVRFLNRIPAWPKDDESYISTGDILAIANEWHQCGVDAGKDVVPEFVPYKGGISDIRVEFVEEGAARSLVGASSNRNAEQPTMWLNLSSCYYPNYKRPIRHEFGHALGLKHEHQHPDAPPQIEKEKLVKYFKKQRRYCLWSEEKIKEKIKSQWERISKSPRQLKSKYDKNSVMHYLSPPEARPQQYKGPTELPVELSEMDKKMIVKFYSKDAPPPPSVPPPPSRTRAARETGHEDGVLAADSEGGIAGASGTSPPVNSTRKGLLDIDEPEDISYAEMVLKNLNADQLKSLFTKLGLSNRTVMNRYNGPVQAYANDLISAWIQGNDKVLESKAYPGGPTWENLKKALEDLGYNGAAAKI